jgi:hypothetical protein
VSAGEGHGACLRMQRRVRCLCQVILQNEVSIGTENFVLNTVGYCGVSIGESLEQKTRVRAV